MISTRFLIQLLVGLCFVMNLDALVGADTVRLVREINLKNTDSLKAEFASVGTVVFFTHYAEGLGEELWTTDGTANSARLVCDIRPGFYSSLPQKLTALSNGLLLFTADDGIHGRELWRSDGTASGTQLVADLASGAMSFSVYASFSRREQTYVLAYNEASASLEVWQTDGTPQGTHLAVTLPQRKDWYLDRESFVSAEGRLYFDFTNISSGVQEMWQTDGTPEGTGLWQSFSKDPTLAESVLFRTAVGPSIYYVRFFTKGMSETTVQLWHSDGTASGTLQLLEFKHKDNNPAIYGLGSVGDQLYFTADDGLSGYEPWLSDGTSGGTRKITDLSAGALSSGCGGYTLVNGTTYFFNTVSHSYSNKTTELWKTDGTATGTTRLQDLGPTSFVRPVGTDFYYLQNSQGKTSLWKTDGLSQPVMIKQLATSSGWIPLTNFIQSMGRQLFFTVKTSPVEYELWVSDGTSSGTIKLASLSSGTLSSNPRNLRSLGQTQYCSARILGRVVAR